MKLAEPGFDNPKTVCIRYNRAKKIRIDCENRNRAIPIFLACTALLAVIGLIFLRIPWLRLFPRVPDMGKVFWKLLHLDFSRMRLILDALVETLSITVLATLYSVAFGLVFAMLASENIFRLRWLSRGTRAFFTFLRAVPTPVWVLLMMVCVGMGPEAGIAGLCVHSTAFFTRAFAQSFETIPGDVLEALATTGVGRIGIFCHAVLPSTLSQLTAWVAMRTEINFAECAILGMVGAGGIGFTIAKSIQAYEYGVAGVAILLVFLFAYSIERVFVALKKYIR